MTRAVGIDLGSRRIGIAVSDGLGLTAQPHATIPRQGGQRDLDAISEMARSVGADQVVMGLPLDPEGNESGEAKRVRAFRDRLAAHIAPLPVALIDESFSTVEAEEVLLAADLSRKRRRQVVDKVAAAIILQRWLDSRRREP